MPRTSMSTRTKGWLVSALAAAVAWGQEPPARIRLEDLENMALANNPTLGQAAASVQAAAGKRLQAGLYPTPP
jgi:outer membrane protein TolC